MLPPAGTQLLRYLLLGKAGRSPLISQLFRVLVFNPARTLLDYSIELTWRPWGFAQRHIEVGDRRNFRQAFGFAVTAFSVGLIVTQLGMFALQIDGISEVSYWLLAAVQLIIFLILLTLILTVTKRTSFSSLLHILMYPLGVAIFMASVLFTVAALTIYAAFKVSYIPSFRLDPSRFLNFEQSILIEYRKCLGSESFIYELVRSAGMQFEELAVPIKYLPLFRTVILLFYLIIFGYLVAKLLGRSLVFLQSAVLMSATATLFALGISIVFYDNYLYANTQCIQKAIQQANAKTAEDQLNLGVQDLRKRFIQDRTLPFYIDDVRVEGRSLVYYYVVDTKRIDESSIPRDSDISRREAVDDYCRPDVRFFYNLDVTLAHVYRAKDGRHLYTYTISRDDCRK
jgi:hypothetical protein